MTPMAWQFVGLLFFAACVVALLIHIAALRDRASRRHARNVRVCRRYVADRQDVTL